MRIEIWSDVACPWCWVGWAHLERALERFEHADEVEITWRSFELDPGAPEVREGEYAELLARKYGGSLRSAEGMIAQMVETGRRAGIEMDFTKIRAGNTFTAHRLIHLAARHGLQHEMKLRLLRAYLGEGALISDPETLTTLGVEVGLPREEVVELVQGDAHSDEVRADEERAGELGVSGVPFILIAGKVAVPGAQPVEVMLRSLQRGWELDNASIEVIGGGEVCGPDGCRIPA